MPFTLSSLIIPQLLESFNEEQRRLPNEEILIRHSVASHFRFDELHDEQNIVGTLYLTPAGKLLVQERERRKNQ